MRNLLFDLGGVIMDIDRNRCVRAFEALGLHDADSYFGRYVQQGIFADLESGAVGVDAFHSYMRAQLLKDGAGNVSDEAIDNAFQKFLLGIPRHRLEALRSLRKRYGVYMLSNTNPIMWNGFIADQFRREGLELKDYFDGVVTSFEARVMKPDAAIFDYAADKLGIVPAETLFLDDSEANCRAARALGWQAALVAPGTEFTDVIANLEK